jgi:hypothetical protein
MFNPYFLKIFTKNALVLSLATSLSASPLPYISTQNQLRHTGCGNGGNFPHPVWLKAGSMRQELWLYLRKGINYLEASGKDVPLGYRHPGGKAYGPLALTQGAVDDVRAHYARFAKYSFADVISKRSLYEKFALLYSELLLSHYLKVDYAKMDKKEVFGLLERAWFLGPTLFRKGRAVIASREIKAKKFMSGIS